MLVSFFALTRLARLFTFIPNEINTRRIKFIILLLFFIFLVSGCSSLNLQPVQPTITEISASETTATSSPYNSPTVTPPTQTSTQIPTSTEFIRTATPVLTELIEPTATSFRLLNEMPKYSSDLLYLSDHKLMRWDYATNFVMGLSEYTYEFSTSNSGRKIALIRSQNMVANGIELFELVILDLDSKQITPLIEASPRMYNLSISPDGEWVSFNPAHNGGRMYILNTNNPDERIEIGFCHQPLDTECAPVAWSTDSEEIAWSDQRGMWQFKLGEGNSELISQNNIQITDPHGVMTNITVSFTSLSWSPEGRYILTKVVPSSSSTQWYAIIDTRTERLIEVPESFQPILGPANSTWLLDGSLLVGFTGIQDNVPTIQLTTYDIVATQNDLLQQVRLHVIPNAILPEPLNTSPTEINYQFNWPFQFSENQLLFGISINEDNSPPILYSILFDKYYVEVINQIPSYTETVLWSLDGGGALIDGGDQGLYYSQIEGGMLFNLGTVLGDSAHSFSWLPPTPR